MNVEIAELARRFGRTQAVAGVDLAAGPGVFGLLGAHRKSHHAVGLGGPATGRPGRGPVRLQS